MSVGDVSFASIGKLSSYFFAVWFAGRILNSVGISSIPGEICMGMVYGPYGLDLIPHFSHSHSLMLFGYMGVSLVIFESGMHLNVNKVLNWDIGVNAFIVAVLGTVLPIVLSIGLFTMFGFEAYPNGLAAGFALAPTSVGISLTLLSQAKQLSTPCGQLVMTAAFLDDVFSVICLVVMTNIANGDFNYLHHVVLPFAQAAAFVLLGLLLSMSLFPTMISYILKPQGLLKVLIGLDSAIKVKDEVHLNLMFAFFLVFAYIGHIIGSALLGAFVAGILFSNVPRSHHLWRRQLKFLTHWLLRLFFAATVAFSIRVAALLSWSAFWKGIIMAIVPCLGAKLLCGVFTGSVRWVVGVAMMARGEFAYLVAEKAVHLNLLKGNEFAIVLWALLWATLLSPVMFGFALERYTMAEFSHGMLKRALEIGGTSFSGDSTFVIRLIGMHHCGMVREICDTLYVLGFDVIESVTESDGHFGSGTFVVCPRDALAIKQRLHIRHNNFSLSEFTEDELKRYKAATDLDENKLHEIAVALKETMGDDDVQVLFEPADVNKEKTILEIELIGERSREVIHEIMRYLMFNCSLNILKAVVDEPESDLEFCVFYCSRDTPPDVQEKNKAEGSLQVKASTDGDSIVGTGESAAQEHKSPPSAAAETDHGDAGGIRKAPVDSDRSKCAAVISEDEMDGIREHIRQVFASNGLTGGEALVRLVHSGEMIYSYNSKTVQAKKRNAGRNRETQEPGSPKFHSINVTFDRDDLDRSLESDYSLDLGGSVQSGGIIRDGDLSSIV